MIGDIGIHGPPDLRWIQLFRKIVLIYCEIDQQLDTINSSKSVSEFYVKLATSIFVLIFINF